MFGRSKNLIDDIFHEISSSAFFVFFRQNSFRYQKVAKKQIKDNKIVEK